jgi:hypothetical protein
MLDGDARMGISEVLLERLEKARLPRILKIKDRVDQGLALDDTDLAFLELMLSDAQKNHLLIESLPECREVFARVIHIYRDITTKALDNEEHKL